MRASFAAQVRFFDDALRPLGRQLAPDDLLDDFAGGVHVVVTGALRRADASKKASVKPFFIPGIQVFFRSTFCSH